MENEEDSLGLFLLNDCLNLDSSLFNSRYHHVNEQKKYHIHKKKNIIFIEYSKFCNVHCIIFND